jgi:hypothetical protein
MERYSYKKIWKVERSTSIYINTKISYTIRLKEQLTMACSMAYLIVQMIKHSNPEQIREEFV